MNATARIFPPRDDYGAAVAEAMAALDVSPVCRLYTDGNRIAWLPQPVPGWFRILGCAVKSLEPALEAEA